MKKELDHFDHKIIRALTDNARISITDFKIPKAIQTAKMTAIRDNLEEIDNLLGIHL